MEFRVIVEKKGALDECSVLAEDHPVVFPDLTESSKKDALDKLADEASKAMKVSLGVRVPVSIVDAGSLERSTLKAKRVIDKRRLPKTN